MWYFTYNNNVERKMNSMDSYDNDELLMVLDDDLFPVEEDDENVQ